MNSDLRSPNLVMTFGSALRGQRPLAVTLALLLAVAATAAAAQGGGADAEGKVRDLLTTAGLRAISPPTPATDFRLPSLDGGEMALSDFEGRWVVLTFFATWCGPCRSEMPSLEKLHRQRADRGVAVVGVSVDTERTPLEPFLNQYSITFPVLWDGQGRAAATYRAGSIPLTYLVDPRGRLVAVSRGARDWWQLVDMMDGLVAAMPPSESGAEDGGAGAQTAYRDDTAPVELPSTVSAPPTADVSLSNTAPTAGETFFLDVHLRWAGNFEEYLPHPPQVLLPEGVHQQNVTAATDSRQGRSQVTYRIALLADQPGSYALDPVELRYTPRFEAEPLASRVTGPTVEVRPRTYAGLAPKTLGVSVAGAAALLGLTAGLFFWRRRRTAAAAAAPSEGRYERLKAQFDEARRRRLQGDMAGCFEILATLHRELAAEEAEGHSSEDRRLDSHLERAIEAARYGGVVPPLAELDSFQRGVERRIEALRPDQRRAERETIRLRDDG